MPTATRPFLLVVAITLLIQAVIFQALAAPPDDAVFDAAEAAYRRGEFASALQSFRLLSDRGHISSNYYLGRMHARGEGVAQSLAEAEEWYRKGADKGHRDSQYRVGELRADAKDFREAAIWFRKSAEQGDSHAQASLAFLLENGLGVPRNSQESLEWTRKAAIQGNAMAQENLGLMYAYGRVVPSSNVKAFMWLDIAVRSGGNPKARDIVRGRLAPSERSVAQEAVAACLRSNLQNCD